MFGSDQLHEIIQLSDYLVIAVPLTPVTRNMINESTFVHTKKGQVLINIARGAIVDELSLVAALSCGFLKGAALDVFVDEPLPTSSLFWDLPNVLISPHNADMTADFRHNSVRLFCENCSRFLEGEELICEIDIEQGY